uniref:Uncharacterized protein n=1 Tax=Anopheles funestus TaxID=62324 RepID=A0A182RAB7_ANOFN
KEHYELHWSCPDCTKAVKGSELHGDIQAGVTMAIKDIQEDLLKTLRTKLSSDSTTSRSFSTSFRSSSQQHEEHNLPSRKRRRLFSDLTLPIQRDGTVPGSNVNTITAENDGTNTEPLIMNNASTALAASFAPFVVGTNTSSSAPLLIAARQAPTPKRIWLHLSGLDKSVTAEHVTSSVAFLLGTKDVIAFSLKRNGITADAMRSLSFKVRIPATLREKALIPETWPIGIRVRDFIFDCTTNPAPITVIASSNTTQQKVGSPSGSHRPLSKVKSKYLSIPFAAPYECAGEKM